MSKRTKENADAEAARRGPLSRVELQLALLLRRAERTGAIRAGHTPTLERSGYLLLQVLSAEGPLGINALAERQGLDASTVTRQVVSLEKAGFARRSRDPRDGRAVQVEATTVGRRLSWSASALGAAPCTTRSSPTGPPPSGRCSPSLLERLNQDLDAFRRDPDD